MNRSAAAALGAAALASVTLSACGGSSAPAGAHAHSGEGSAAASVNPYSYGKNGSVLTTSSRTKLASDSSKATTVITKSAKGLGTILASGSTRRTLYMFAADKGGKSMCNGQCASIWPPLTTSGAAHAGAGTAASALGTITRSNGQKQVTYDGHPLYFYEPDVSASDTLGEGIDSFGARWYVLSPAGKPITKG